ncbi:MAG TPA: RHS repeat-associated core domain-containing protein, partial [Crocinitomicaceae bacterium]|nr:RHS repeat-associated core domain-containing protein [Crocinitomicaceae bacterium]
RQCIADSELLSVFNGPPIDWEIACYRVDWTGLPNILDVKIFETNSEYDALNRVTKVIYPEDADSNRKIGIPTYNRAGGLQKVAFDGTDYVKHIAYNAKGQRLLIAFGNDVMTRYLYDNRTFRLLRLNSEKFTQTDWTFTPQSGTTKQDYLYINDLIGNIVAINDKSPNCGVGGTNSLDRAFEYDPLYRLINANGRENNPSTPYPWWDDVYRSTDNSTTTAYTQHYQYDKLGNIQKLQHIGNNNFTRNFNYSNANNKLNSIDIGMTNYAFEYDECGNQKQETANRHFEWDFGDNIRCFYNQVGTAEPTVYAQYLYDSTGNRVKKIVRTQGGDYESVSYINGAFEYKTDGTDEQNTLHIMDDQSRIALVRLGDDFGDTTPAIKYNLEDHLGSSCILLETNGALINKEEYYPFGETSFGSYAKKRYKFSGKERDNESGFYYYGARYYMAWACRFVSCDPLAGKYSNLSSYNYAADNPIKFIDDNGEGPRYPEIADLFEDQLKKHNKYVSYKRTNTSSGVEFKIKMKVLGKDVYTTYKVNKKTDDYEAFSDLTVWGASFYEACIATSDSWKDRVYYKVREIETWMKKSPLNALIAIASFIGTVATGGELVALSKTPFAKWGYKEVGTFLGGLLAADDMSPYLIGENKTALVKLGINEKMLQGVKDAKTAFEGVTNLIDILNSKNSSSKALNMVKGVVQALENMKTLLEWVDGNNEKNNQSVVESGNKKISK